MAFAATCALYLPTLRPARASEALVPPAAPPPQSNFARALTLAIASASSAGGPGHIPRDAHERVVEDAEELSHYSASQHSYHRGAPPTAVVFPRSTEEVAALVRVCAAGGISIIPRSGGTSLEGQVVPSTASSRPTVVLDFKHMARVLSVNEKDMDIKVQAGVGWVSLASALKPYGLMFAVDPGPGAQIGGMCGTGCSGTHAVRHGAMKANVLSLTAVASDGTIFKTGNRARKSVAGLDLTSLLIGSEGTLAVVTEAVLRVVPLPETTTIVCTPFRSVRCACQAVAEAMRQGLPLGAAELLDARMAGVVRAQNDALLPAGAVPHVVWKLSGPPGAVQEAAGRLRAVAEASGAFDWQASTSAESAEALWEARKSALFSVQAAHPESSVLTTDVCVPISSLPQLLESFEAHYESACSSAEPGTMPTAFAVAHAGDGNA